MASSSDSPIRKPTLAVPSALFFLSVVSSQLGGQQAQTLESPILSPSVRVLQTALDEGRQEALDAFWLDVERSGTPLIEQTPDDDEHLLITFLWRSGEPLVGVALTAGLTNWSPTRLTQMSDTDAWYHTFRVRTDARILTTVGQSDEAIDLIEDLLSWPGGLTVETLRAEPQWDPLRDDPGFQALLELYE